MKLSIHDFLEQLYELVEYAKKALSLTGVLYLVTWHRAFPAPRIKGWNNILLMIRLLSAVPVSNAKLERMFFKCVKGPHSYKSCSFAKVNVRSLSDDDSFDEKIYF